MPELAMFGLDVQTMHVLLNALGRKAADGACWRVTRNFTASSRTGPSS
nr:hypothetical protein [Streptomyces sp. SCL15-6]